ncbi:MAG: EF-hand domain-containing protein [Pseudomonadota bacterium]
MNVSTVSTAISSTTQLSQKQFTRMDSDGDGAVSREEFAQASPSGGANEGAAPTDAPSVEEIWSQLDDDGNGGLSIEELSEMASRFQSGTGAAPAGGAPPAGGPPMGGAQATSGAEESESSSTVYDEADTNQDGEVSEAERQAYELEQLMDSTEDDDGGLTWESARAIGAYQAAAALGE